MTPEQLVRARRDGKLDTVPTWFLLDFVDGDPRTSEEDRRWVHDTFGALVPEHSCGGGEDPDPLAVTRS